MTGLQRLCAGDDSADGSAAVRGRRNPTYASSATVMETMLVQNSARCDGVNAVETGQKVGIVVIDVAAAEESERTA